MPIGRRIVHPTLETETDKFREDGVIDRIVRFMGPPSQAHRLPQFSLADFIITNRGVAVALIELKIRKETVEQIKGYGGLMLKHRKVTDLNALAEMTKMHTFVMFAFENGTGPILVTQPHLIKDLPPEDPPRRRNYRGLATDEEPVVYLDWDQHLRQVDA